jgi:hypothetical protein
MFSTRVLGARGNRQCLISLSFLLSQSFLSFCSSRQSCSHISWVLSHIPRPRIDADLGAMCIKFPAVPLAVRYVVPCRRCVSSSSAVELPPFFLACCCSQYSRHGEACRVFMILREAALELAIVHPLSSPAQPSTLISCTPLKNFSHFLRNTLTLSKNNSSLSVCPVLSTLNIK